MMERKKKRDKSSGDGGVIDSSAAQPGAIHPLQKEAEQQGCAKKLAAGGANSDSPTQPFLPSLNSSCQSNQQTSQASVLASMPQPSAQIQQQPTSQQGLQGGGQQQLPPGQQALSGWQKPECSAQNAGAAHHSPHPGSADSNWLSCGAQGTGGTVASFNYPGGFVFPPPPAYPGPWDPMSWWAHSTPQQAVYPYSFPGYGNGFAYPVSPAPVIGTIQRGFIKTPPGLSQKHRQLWEAQSIENAQLWSTVTRAEAAISCQRSKILELEGILLAIKVHQDTVMDASAVATTQPARRGRQKKVVPAPMPMAGLPASEPTPLRSQGRKSVTSRPNRIKIDVAKDTKEIVSREKETCTLTNHMPAVMNGFTKNQDQKSSSLTVGLSRIESGAERNPHRNTVECQGGGNENDRLIGERKDLDYTHVNQSSLNPNVHPGIGKDANCEQNMQMEEASMVTSLKSSGNVDKQAATSGHSAFKRESTGMSRKGNWSVSDGNHNAKNVMIRAQLQAHYDSNGVERSNAIGSGKAIDGWQYAGEDISDEQDEVIASGQDDNDGDDDDDETTLDNISIGKVGNYMVLDSTTARSKEMTAFSRW